MEATNVSIMLLDIIGVVPFSDTYPFRKFS
jgi:hypothetical protein